MNDYISRDDVLRKFIEGDGNDEFTEGYNIAVNEHREKIKAMSAANVQPIRHGRWIDACCEIECSCCNTRYHDDIINMCYDWSNDKINYCPNCGARMDGEQND